MNRWQTVIVWILGLYVSLIISDTGLKLLVHAKTAPETLETGYPFTLLAGTAWAYVIPIVIIGVLVFITVRENKKK
jgi:hypothetical protein